MQFEALNVCLLSAQFESVEISLEEACCPILSHFLFDRDIARKEEFVVIDGQAKESSQSGFGLKERRERQVSACDRFMKSVLRLSLFSPTDQFGMKLGLHLIPQFLRGFGSG